MSLRERMENLLGKKEADYPVPTGIAFWDLTDPIKAENKGVDSGYYVTLHGVVPKASGDRNFILKYSANMQLVAMERGPNREKGARIPIDNEGKVNIDLSNTWRFTPEGYDEENQVLVMRAELLSDEEAAPKIISSLSTYEILSDSTPGVE